MLTELRELYGFNDWANTRTLDAAARLAPDQLTREIGGSFPSLWTTLMHIYGAERSWFARWQGTPEGVTPDAIVVNDLPDLHGQWSTFADERTRWLANVSEETTRRTIPIRLRSGLRFEQQLGATMRHVVNHSTYHRGQITNFLRQVGAEPVATDLVLYYMEHPPS